MRSEGPHAAWTVLQLCVPSVWLLICSSSGVCVSYLCSMYPTSLCSTGTVAFASQDAALRAAAHWQGACELGEAITAQLVAPPGPQQQQQEPQPPPQQPTLLPPQTSSAPQQQQQPPRQQQAAQQPPWPQQQEEADVPPQHAPRSPLRRRPAPKPAIVVRCLGAFCKFASAQLSTLSVTGTYTCGGQALVSLILLRHQRSDQCRSSRRAD